MTEASLDGVTARTLTDSGLVLIDLCGVDAKVAASFLRVFSIDGADGGEMPTQDFVAFWTRCQNEVRALDVASPSESLQFVLLLTTFIHELRHIHDLRGTTIGAELLLAGSDAYRGVQLVEVALRSWCAQAPTRRVPLPLTPDWLAEQVSEQIAAIWRQSLAQYSHVIGLWNKPAAHRVNPGISILDLFEIRGFETQAVFAARAFGPHYGEAVVRSAIPTGQARNRYVYARSVLQTLLEARGFYDDLGDTDLAIMISASLRDTTIERAFDGEGRPTEWHPTTLLMDYLEEYVHLLRGGLTDDDVPGDSRVVHGAVEEVLVARASDDDPAERFAKARALMDSHIRAALSGTFSRIVENVLVADVGVDMSDIWRKGDAYHDAMLYMRDLLDGELPPATVAIRRDRNDVAFCRTPSVVSTHPGVARVAAQASLVLRALSAPASAATPWWLVLTLDTLRAPTASAGAIRFATTPPFDLD